MGWDGVGWVARGMVDPQMGASLPFMGIGVASPGGWLHPIHCSPGVAHVMQTDWDPSNRVLNGSEGALGTAVHGGMVEGSEPMGRVTTAVAVGPARCWSPKGVSKTSAGSVPYCERPTRSSRRRVSKGRWVGRPEK